MNLEEQLADLLKGGQQAIDAKKKLRGKKRSSNPHRELTTKQTDTGKHIVVEIDHRMSSPYWADTHRVLIIREVHCKQCDLIQSAPNDLLMLRKMHPTHGCIEEAIGPHDSPQDHLPIDIKTLRMDTPICQHCISEEQRTGSATGHSSQYELDFTETNGTAVDLDDLFTVDIDDPENQAALEGF